MLDTWLFRVMLIPSAVFLSVVFGGSYGTGREVMEFISRHGPLGGLVALGAVVLTYGVLLSLTFEIARRFRTYEYRSFCERLLGRGWFLYELVIMVGMVITLAVCVTAAGTMLESRLGVSQWIGSLVLLAIVFLLNYQGRKLVEKSMILSVSALFLVLAGLVYQLLGDTSEQILQRFANDTLDASSWASGAQYALVNGGFIPLLLYCAAGLRTRKDTVIAGFFAGSVAVLPGLVFHFAFMSAYPAITEERLPTYWLMEQHTTALFFNFYLLVLFVLIAQTGVGMLQGFLERLDAWMQQRRGKPLSRLGHGGVAVGMVVASMLLGSMGIIALIITGYSILAVSFILVFAVPLLTRGVWLVTSARRQ